MNEEERPEIGKSQLLPIGWRIKYAECHRKDGVEFMEICADGPYDLVPDRYDMSTKQPHPHVPNQEVVGTGMSWKMAMDDVNGKIKTGEITIKIEPWKPWP